MKGLGDDIRLFGVVGWPAAVSSSTGSAFEWAREGLIIVGGAVGVAIICFILVISLRSRLHKGAKRRRRRRGRGGKQRPAKSQDTPSSPSKETGSSNSSTARQQHGKGHDSRRRGRRRQRPRRPHNPTLAETGGLPPKRPPEQPKHGYDI